MSKDEFIKLFKYMNERFDKIDKTLESKADKVDMDTAYGLLDRIIKMQEINEQERLAMGHQLTRHDKWIDAIADKIGHKLTT